jgi:phosphoserine phosphatase|tara:strand:- start:950 stop:1537 length:588 start_codon:yes stop_codon:yes gene_type:complete
VKSSSNNLIVDLDHTLIDTDLLVKSSFGVLRKSPWLILHYFLWLSKGKGYLKDQLVRRFEINVTHLPYNKTVINYVRQRKDEGNRVILATASHKNYAFAIAKYLQLFDDVMATNKDLNLSSYIKAEKLIERFGEGNFDYVGDHMRDLPVWEASKLSIIVNASRRVISRTEHLNRLIITTKGQKSSTKEDTPAKKT